MGGRAQSALAAILTLASLLIAGCGTPGAPLPPSLKLPDPVTDLAAVRTGNQVALTWTMPRRTTDKLLLKGNIAVRICRGQSSGKCAAIPADLAFAPLAHATFTDTLPMELAAGAARPLNYFVELTSPKGRSAGPSNEAIILAGEAPAPVANLAAEVRKRGVVLRWTADPADTQPSERMVIRLHRTLLTPKPAAEAEAGAAAKPTAQPGILAPPAEPVEQSLLAGDLVHPGNTPDRVLDKTIRFGQTYQYSAQRVARVPVCGPIPADCQQSTDCKIFELPGPLSDPIRVEAIDVFPPAVPTGLAAVATVADSSTTASPSPSPSPSIDLSWQPVTDRNLAGYAVYRREGEAEWQRISPVQPVVGPGFHDPDVQPGHAYRYAVTAIDQLGHESKRSVEAEETVPNP